MRIAANSPLWTAPSIVAQVNLGVNLGEPLVRGKQLYIPWNFGAFDDGTSGIVCVDISDPLAPREAGYFIPEPAAGQVAPQTNDVDIDARGLVYIVDRYSGFDILEFARS